MPAATRPNPLGGFLRSYAFRQADWETPPPSPSLWNLWARPHRPGSAPDSTASLACAKSTLCWAGIDRPTDKRTAQQELRSPDLAAAVSRSGRVRSCLAFVTILASPAEPGDSRVPTRPTSEILGRDRGRSGATGAARIYLGVASTRPAPGTWLSSGPLCSMVPSPTRGRSPWTTEGSGWVESPGAQKLSRSPRPGAACTPGGSWGPRGVLAPPLCTPWLHVVPCLGSSCPRPPVNVQPTLAPPVSRAWLCRLSFLF